MNNKIVYFLFLISSSWHEATSEETVGRTEKSIVCNVAALNMSKVECRSFHEKAIFVAEGEKKVKEKFKEVWSHVGHDYVAHREYVARVL